MRLNSSLGRYAVIALVFVAAFGAVAVGGRIYLGHLSDPPATAGQRSEVVEVADLEADPVGTCYTLIDDTRDDAVVGAQHWDVVICASPHTSEVVALIDLETTDIPDDPSAWGTAELTDATQACADAATTPDTPGVADPTSESVLSATVRGDQLMCVATSDLHRHIDGQRVDVDD